MRSVICGHHAQHQSTSYYLTALRCVQQQYRARHASYGRHVYKMMIDGGWAQQLVCHACPRHSMHLCRHSPHCLRRLGAASTRSRWKAALVDRCRWFSKTARILGKVGPVSCKALAGTAAACRTRWGMAAGRSLSELQVALTMQVFLGSPSQS